MRLVWLVGWNPLKGTTCPTFLHPGVVACRTMSSVTKNHITWSEYAHINSFLWIRAKSKSSVAAVRFTRWYKSGFVLVGLVERSRGANLSIHPSIRVVGWNKAIFLTTSSPQVDIEHARFRPCPHTLTHASSSSTSSPTGPWWTLAYALRTDTCKSSIPTYVWVCTTMYIHSVILGSGLCKQDYDYHSGLGESNCLNNIKKWHPTDQEKVSAAKFSFPALHAHVGRVMIEDLGRTKDERAFPPLH